MHQRSLLGAAVISASLLILPASTHADSVNIALGMHGVALEYYKGLSPRVNARFALTDVPFSHSAEFEDIEYNIEYDRTNIGMLFDFRPFAGTFHLTTGVYVGRHHWNLDAKSNNAEYQIGNEVYESNDLKMKSQIRFARAAPYAGFGWGNSTRGKGLAANLDIGVLYTGKPSIDTRASGTAVRQSDGVPILDIGADPAFQSDLERERADLEKKAEDFRLLPIIQLGLGYSF